MAIRIYNSLTRGKETLTTHEPGKVGMYVCGPTVYDDCHIGHLMGPVLFDSIARWLAQRDYDVRFVNNITDIDDKIINRAKDTGEPWTAITERYTGQYFDLMSQLNVTTVTDNPRATEYVDQIIAYIKDLVDRDFAYMADDGVYFEVNKHDDYGKLSGRKVEDMQSGARIDVQGGLRHGADFCLWKLAKPDEPSWPSPWGDGRPGWHIECSVMSSTLLGDSFDIHGGGDDLKFPHHENEIAQGEAHGGSYATCWMHNGLIQYEGSKISKSDPRNKDPEFRGQFKAQNLISKYGAEALRFFILQGHYRRPFDFAPKNLEAAKTALAKLRRQLGDLINEEITRTFPEILAAAPDEETTKRITAFAEAMDDDFNTGNALGHLFAIAAAARKAQANPALGPIVRDLGRILGLFTPETPETNVAADDGFAEQLMELILGLRQNAKANRDFATADAIRDQLQALDITITDSKDGATWSRKE